jgi:hypothetical protein
MITLCVLNKKVLKFANMSETLHQGFSRENVERIYHGKPALIDGQLPTEILQGERLQIMSLVAEGLKNREIGAVMEEMDVYDMRQHIAFGLNQLGIVSRSQLAGFFPFDPEHKAVRGKKLADLPTGVLGLTIVQDLSIGRPYSEIAAERYGSNPLGGALHYLTKVWPDAKGGLLLTRVMNALRASCLQAIETRFGTLEGDYLHRLTLPFLVAVEPAFDLLVMENRGVTNLTPADS